jgi:hypothetical protein
MPSSRLTHPRAELGMVISQRSLINCTLTALSSFSSFFVSTTFSGSDDEVMVLECWSRL